MRRLRKGCCCWVALRPAALGLAVLHALLGLAMLAFALLENGLANLNIAFLLYCVFYLVYLCFSVTLCVGVCRRRRHLLLPWLVYQAFLQLVYALIICGYAYIYHMTEHYQALGLMLLFLAFFVLQGWSWLVVWSYHQELRETHHSVPLYGLANAVYMRKDSSQEQLQDAAPAATPAATPARAVTGPLHEPPSMCVDRGNGRN